MAERLTPKQAQKQLRKLKGWEEAKIEVAPPSKAYAHWSVEVDVPDSVHCWGIMPIRLYAASSQSRVLRAALAAAEAMGPPKI